MNSNWNYPTTMWVGKDRVKDLSIACKTLNINKPLLVTDSGLAKSKIVINVLNNLKERKGKQPVFDKKTQELLKNHAQDLTDTFIECLNNH